MQEFTTEEIRVIHRALRLLARSREARLDYDTAELAEELSDRVALELESRP